ncbi:MAG: carboxylating nicotinate-nucleotide diphosphorylase [Deltaproteobacteria bacterium]|nr:MAG: carboxylating nicotinate-nucleotide diphosphorylase [Deltaproteobacteria bacterium]
MDLSAFGFYQPQVDRLIDLALEEDVGTGDRTTLATIPAESTGVGRVLVKERLVLAGMPFFARVFARVDPAVTVTVHVPDGTLVEPGIVVAEVHGATRSLLVGERTALNILQRLSGVATLTRRFVDAVAGTGAKVCDTRKTTPGMRVMQKYAVAMGGGSNHRFGLDSGVLIKDNHIAACGGVTAAIERARAASPHLLKIEVEVKNLDELELAIAARADVILLDNMTTEAMAEAVRRVRATGLPILTEASGNLGLARLREVAETGVDLLSVGALTHSAVAADLSMKL